MVKVYDMLAGTWTDEEQEDEGVGRGGCCRQAPEAKQRRAAIPRLQLALLPVSATDASTRWPR